MVKCGHCEEECVAWDQWHNRKIMICKTCLVTYDTSSYDAMKKMSNVDLQLMGLEEVYGSKSELYSIWEDNFREFITSFVKKMGIVMKSNETILDIGCADGHSKLGFESLGLKYYGTDLSSIPFVKYQPEIYYISKEKSMERTFDYVFAWHVLEHFDNGKECIEWINQITHSDSIVMIQVPSLHEQHLYDAHFCFYSLYSFSYLFDNFETIYLEKDETNSFITFVGRKKQL